MIKSPKKYSNLSFTEAMDKYKWTRKRGKAFNDIVRKLPMNVRCSKMGQDEWSVSDFDYTGVYHILLFSIYAYANKCILGEHDRLLTDPKFLICNVAFPHQKADSGSSFCLY